MIARLARDSDRDGFEADDKLKVLLGRVRLALLPHVVGGRFGKMEPPDGDLKTCLSLVQVQFDWDEFSLRTVGLALLDFDSSAWDVTFHSVKIDLKITDFLKY